MNQNDNRRPQNRNPGSGTPSPARRSPPSARPGGSRPPLTTPPRRRKKRSPIPLLVLGAVFVICMIFYIVNFLVPSSGGKTPSTDPPKTNAPDTNPPVTTPDTTPPDTADPGTDDPGTQVPATQFTVVLDPGHGFADSGCGENTYLNGTYEKDLTLDMCRRIQPILAAQGVKVIFTHDGAAFPSMATLNQTAAAQGFSMETFSRELIRQYGVDKNGNPVDADSTWSAFAARLNESNLFNVWKRAYYINLLAQAETVDALVSVHVNANEDSDSLSAFMVDCSACNGYQSQSAQLQQSVISALHATFPAKVINQSKNPWYDDYVILKYSAVPAVLIETGYATTPGDAADLLSETWRQQMSETIAAGILAYLGLSTAA